jgi:SsrA-binding protein
MKIFAQNRKAYHEYFIEETFEAGMVLLGTEVKSIRDGRVNLKEGFVLIKDSEVFLLNCHINPYSHGNRENHDPLRTRKLLLHEKEIRKLIGKAKEKGYTLIPLKVYLKGQLIKLELGIAKGKKQYEKREQIKEREVKREIATEFKNFNS